MNNFSGLTLALLGLCGAVLRSSDDADDRNLGNLLLAGAAITTVTNYRRD